MAGGWWLVFYSSNYQIFFRKKNVPGFFKLDQVFDIGLKVEICTKLKLSEPGTFLQNLVKKPANAAADTYFKFRRRSWYEVIFPNALLALVPLLVTILILILFRKKL